MIDRNENRPGYRKTKVGWIPESWEIPSFNQVCDTIRDGTHFSPKLSDGPYKYITSRNIRTNNLDLTNCFHISEEEHRKIYRTCPVKKGQVFLTKDGANTGQACLNPLEEEVSLLSSIAVLDGNKDFLLNEFLLQWIISPRGQYSLKNEITGQAITRITLAVIGSLQVPLPPLPEQKKIAEILSTWDEAIEQTRKLIEAKKRRKKALMQQLLTGKKRLLGKNHQHAGIESESMDWEWPRTKDLFKRHSMKPASSEAVLSVTQNNGVVLRDSLDRRIDYKQTNTGSYKLVSPGDFIISLRSFQGGIEYSSVQGVVSPAYHVIRASKNIEPLFYKYYFKSNDFIKHLAVAIIGIRDGKQVSYQEFSAMLIPHPPIEEQRAIADVLSSADIEIKALDEKLSALMKQKRGLMQKLLTGTIRTLTVRSN